MLFEISTFLIITSNLQALVLSTFETGPEGPELED